MKSLIKILITGLVFQSFLGCVAKKAVYVYGTPEFEAKQKELNYSLEEAVAQCRNYLDKQEQLDTVHFIRLDIMYGNDYIFLLKPMHYNLKTTEYWPSGIWVNGNNGVTKEVKTRKPIRVVLEYMKHKPYYNHPNK